MNCQLSILAMIAMMNFAGCGKNNDGDGEKPELGGTVSITGERTKESLLTASYNPASGEKSAEMGKPTWTWYRGTSTTSIGTGSLYDVKDDDLGKTLKAEISYEKCNGSKSATIDIPEAVAAPSLSFTAIELPAGTVRTQAVMR